MEDSYMKKVRYDMNGAPITTVIGTFRTKEGKSADNTINMSDSDTEKKTRHRIMFADELPGQQKENLVVVHKVQSYKKAYSGGTYDIDPQ